MFCHRPVPSRPRSHLLRAEGEAGAGGADGADGTRTEGACGSAGTGSATGVHSRTCSPPAGERATSRISPARVSLEDGRRVAERYVDYHNIERLHSALGCITPHTWLEDRPQDVFDERDHKLEEARRRRAESRSTITELPHATV